MTKETKKPKQRLDSTLPNVMTISLFYHLHFHLSWNGQISRNEMTRHRHHCITIHWKMVFEITTYISFDKNLEDKLWQLLGFGCGNALLIAHFHSVFVSFFILFMLYSFILLMCYSLCFYLIFKTRNWEDIFIILYLNVLRFVDVCHWLMSVT